MDRERLRLGVVGCGAVFERYHSPALARSPEWLLAAACDLSSVRRGWIRRSHPGVRVFNSPSALLAEDRLDAVLVATPPDTHAELALEALGAGLHVLVEKPMATRLGDAGRLVDAAEAEGRTLRVGFNRRFRSGYPEARGELEGATERIRAIRHVFAADERWRSEGHDFDGPFDLLLHDVACHQADLVAWITGRTVREARARPLGAGVQMALRLEPDLMAECTATYSRRYVERMEVDLPSGCLVIRPGGLSRGRRAGGELIDRIRQAVDLSASRWLGKPSRTIRSFERQLAAFARAVRGTRSGGADARDGFRAVAVVEACLESLADDGGWKRVRTQREAVGR